MLDFNGQPININLVMEELIETCETGDLERVVQLLQIPAVLENEELIEALTTAAFKGHLNIVNHFLEIPAILENNAWMIEILSSAVFGGHLDVINRLFQTPVILDIDHEDSADLLISAIGRSDNNTFMHVNRLLEITTIRDNAHRNNNIAFRLACGIHRLDIANRLLEIPRVSMDLMNMDREGFLGFFKNVLDAIEPYSAIQHEEISLVNKLRRIGEHFELTDADFTHEHHIRVLQRAREDLLSILLDALDSTPEERASKRRFSPAYDEARSSVPVSDDEMRESPSRCRWRCR